MVDGILYSTFKKENMVEKTNEELMYFTQEEQEFYDKCVEGLPTIKGFSGDGLDKYGVPIPYGSSPHIAKYFRVTLGIVKPNAILEIGFNFGCGAALLLNLSDAQVVSLDISDKDETIQAAKILKDRFGERFEFYFRKDFLNILFPYFQLCFIDADHKEESVAEDIQLALDLGIPYILFDDWYPRFGAAAEAIKRFPNLKLVHDMDNLQLYSQ